MEREGTSTERLEVHPDPEAVEDALVAAAQGGRGFADGRRFITLGQLVDHLSADRLQKRRPCSPAEGRVLLWGCARRLAAGPFGAFAEEPAFARFAWEILSQLKGSGVAPAEAEAAAEALPAGRRPRAKYLAHLYAAYQTRLGEKRLVDREDRIRAAIQRLESGERPPLFDGVGEIEVAGLVDFPPSRLELVIALARRCERDGIYFCLDVPAAGTPEVDAAVDPAFAALERLGEVELVEAQKAVPEPSLPLAALGRALFSSTAPSGAAVEAAPALEMWSAASPRDEVRGIASRIARWISGGVPPDQIAVVWRELDEDATALEEELESLGVPARIRRGAPIASSAAGRLALSLPLLVEDGYPAREVARILASPYAPSLSAGCPDRPAALLALAAVRDDRLGASGGKGAYAVRLGQLAARLEGKDPRTAAEARALGGACRRLFDACASIPSEGTAAELLAGWWTALERLGWARSVNRVEPRDDEQSTFGRAQLRATAADQAAVEALRAVKIELERALESADMAGERISRRAFDRWLRDAAGDVSLPSRGPRAGAVRIAEVAYLASRQIDRVCVAQVVDGRFPGRPGPGALLSDEDLHALNGELGRPVFRLATGDVEGRAPWRLAQDRLLFFRALVAARGLASVSYARRAGGQELLPSPFIDELSRATSASVRAYPPRVVEAVEDIFTEQALRERTALEALARPELRISAPDSAGPELERRLSAEPWFAHARRAAEIELERLRAFADPLRPPTPFTGNVAAPELLPLLAETFRCGPERPLSASSLDRYGNCAFQGFLSHVLRLREPEEAGEEIDSRGQGSFWHKVLEELFPRLREEKLLGRAPEEIPDALLDASLDAAAREAEQSSHVGHPALWRLGRERARGMVRRLLATEERGLPFEGFVPHRTELRFGRPEAPEGWRVVAVPGAGEEPPIHLEGKIDRLDLGPDGRVAIVDYKSAKVRKGKALEENLLTTDFQLPLYLYAARAAGHAGAAQAAWLSMRDGAAIRLEEVCEGLDEMLAADPAARERVALAGGKSFVGTVQELVSGLRAGRFPIHPHGCETCAFGAVCRFTRRKVEDAA